MKKIFLAVAIILLGTSLALANKADRKVRREVRHERREERKEIRKQKREENKNEVSYQTRQQFPRDFPEAKNVVFEKTRNFDEVVFTSGNKRLRAFYDNDDKLVGTAEEESFSALPEKAQTEIERQYNDYSVKDVILFHDNETNDTDMILYATPFEDSDNYFVGLKKGNREIVVKVNMSGKVSHFTDMK